MCVYVFKGVCVCVCVCVYVFKDGVGHMALVKENWHTGKKGYFTIKVGLCIRYSVCVTKTS